MTAIDLELAQELQSVCKEKNITMPESDKAWVKYADERYIKYNEPFVLQYAVVDEDYEYIAPAFTLDELLEWLPKYIQIDDDDENDFYVYYRGLNWSIDPDGWIAEYQAYMYHSKSYCAELLEMWESLI